MSIDQIGGPPQAGPRPAVPPEGFSLRSTNRRLGEKAILALPSGEIRRVPQNCRATIGIVGRADANVRNVGKAGRNRWLGVRPTVRGNAQNPIAHPLGGGEGHTNGGRQHCSPWALVDGKKTRVKKNRSNVHIIRRRDGNVDLVEA